MSCNLYTLSGLNASCKRSNKGGIKKMYVAPYEGVVYSIDELTHTIVPELLPNYKVAEYSFGKNAASMMSTYDRSTNMYVNEINIRFNVMDGAKREEMMALLNTYSVIIAIDNNNKIWYFGKDNYVQGISGDAFTGRLKNDRSGFTMRFSDVSDSLPYGMTDDELYNFINPHKVNYFYFQSRQDGSKVRMLTTTALTVELEYSFDKTQWQNWDFTDITLDSGDTVYFRGNNENGLSKGIGGGIYSYMFNTISGVFNIGGDIRSLVDKSMTITTPPAYGLCNLFRDCQHIYNVDPKLLCGFTEMSEKCFMYMFFRCRNLMNAPELPATTLAQYCYYELFHYCENLVTAPELPATTLKYVCYEKLFDGCSNLNYIKCLATDISAGYTTYRWVNGVAANGTFVKANGMNDWTSGVDGIPNGWTVVDA